MSRISHAVKFGEFGLAVKGTRSGNQLLYFIKGELVKVVDVSNNYGVEDLRKKAQEVVSRMGLTDPILTTTESDLIAMKYK